MKLTYFLSLTQKPFNKKIKSNRVTKIFICYTIKSSHKNIYLLYGQFENRWDLRENQNLKWLEARGTEPAPNEFRAESTVEISSDFKSTRSPPQKHNNKQTQFHRLYYPVSNFHFTVFILQQQKRNDPPFILFFLL